MIELQPHYCYFKPNNIEKLQKEDNERKIFVFYDIESTQDNGVHRPNLLCRKTCCDSCYNTRSECDICSVLKSKEYYFGNDCIRKFNIYLFDNLAKLAETHNANIYAFAHNARGYDNHFIYRFIKFKLYRY